MKTLIIGLLASTTVLLAGLPEPDESSMRSRECNVACKRGGWQMGTYSQKTNTCDCTDRVDYEQMMDDGRVLVLKTDKDGKLL